MKFNLTLSMSRPSVENTTFIEYEAFSRRHSPGTLRDYFLYGLFEETLPATGAQFCLGYGSDVWSRAMADLVGILSGFPGMLDDLANSESAILSAVALADGFFVFRRRRNEVDVSVRYWGPVEEPKVLETIPLVELTACLAALCDTTAFAAVAVNSGVWRDTAEKVGEEFRNHAAALRAMTRR